MCREGTYLPSGGDDLAEAEEGDIVVHGPVVGGIDIALRCGGGVLPLYVVSG